MNYKWLLFDADGTLFDYDMAEKTALATTLAEFSLPYSEEALATYRKINEELWCDFELGKVTQEYLKVERFARLLATLSMGGVPAPDIFSWHYLENLGKCTDLITGAEYVMEKLKGNVNMALITNGLKKVQRSRLDKSSIGKYFEVVLISDELGAAKPHPSIFDAAFDAMKNPDKEHVLIIGDSLSSDIKGGSDYGIDTCWFNPHGKRPDVDIGITYEIQSLWQILDILQIPDV